jgi:hypothetical protein
MVVEMEIVAAMDGVTGVCLLEQVVLHVSRIDDRQNCCRVTGGSIQVKGLMVVTGGGW